MQQSLQRRKHKGHIALSISIRYYIMFFFIDDSCHVVMFNILLMNDVTLESMPIHENTNNENIMYEPGKLMTFM